jgi:hypothetical protein
MSGQDVAGVPSQENIGRSLPIQVAQMPARWVVEVSDQTTFSRLHSTQFEIFGFQGAFETKTAAVVEFQTGNVRFLTAALIQRLAMICR